MFEFRKFEIEDPKETQYTEQHVLTVCGGGEGGGE